MGVISTWLVCRIMIQYFCCRLPSVVSATATRAAEPRRIERRMANRSAAKTSVITTTAAKTAAPKIAAMKAVAMKTNTMKTTRRPSSTAIQTSSCNLDLDHPTDQQSMQRIGFLLPAMSLRIFPYRHPLSTSTHLSLEQPLAAPPALVHMTSMVTFVLL